MSQQYQVDLEEATLRVLAKVSTVIAGLLDMFLSKLFLVLSFVAPFRDICCTKGKITKEYSLGM